MALKKVFQKYLSNIFISIVQQGNEWFIHSKVVQNGILRDKFSKNFDAKEYESIPVKMQEYLENLQVEYNFAYLALFLDSMGQGAINGTAGTDFGKNSVDIKSVTHFDINKSWSVYASFIDINWAKKLFTNVGLDFIYSPFMVKYSLIKKSKFKEKPILYMLNHQDSITISVFDNGNLLFGAYFKTTTDENLSSGEEDWENVEEEEGIENITELDNMSGDIGELDELDDLEDLNDIESLDSEESSNFEDISSEDGSLGHFEDDTVEDSDLELFGRDILIYKYLTSSLQEFYKNPLYKSSFIDTIVIYDGYEISSELIGMIEDELLMDIEMNKIDISETICNMARQEVLL